MVDKFASVPFSCKFVEYVSASIAHVAGLGWTQASLPSSPGGCDAAGLAAGREIHEQDLCTVGNHAAARFLPYTGRCNHTQRIVDNNNTQQRLGRNHTVHFR